MTKAILVIDDIPESMFTEKISIRYKLIYYPDGHLKELGICGKQLLKPLPKKYIKIAQISNGKVINTEDMQFMAGYNKCLDEILEGE